MINIKHSLKVASAWISIVYAVCYFGVAFFPQSRQLFTRYALHSEVSFSSSYFGFGYFVSGLVMWNIVALLGVGLFAWLYNTIRK